MIHVRACCAVVIGLFILAAGATSVFAQKELKNLPKALKGVNPKTAVAKGAVVNVKVATPAVRPDLSPALERVIATQAVMQTATPRVQAATRMPRVRGPHKTPEEILAQVEDFIAQKQYFPSHNSTDHAELLLRNAFNRISVKAESLSEPTKQRVLALREQWIRNYAVRRTPQEIVEEVEAFIATHGRFPSPYAEDETERSLRQVFDKACPKAQNKDDEFSVRLLALKEQWVNKIADPRSSQEVLTQVEAFIQEKGRFPSLSSKDEGERSLRKAFDHAYDRATNLDDEVTQKLIALKKKWVRRVVTFRTPQEVLAEVEAFIAKKGRFPMFSDEDGAEYSLRNAFNYAAVKAKGLNDPTSQRLLALKKQWIRGYGPSRLPGTPPKKVVQKEPRTDAAKAAKLAEQYLAEPNMVTDDYIDDLIRFYNQIDPFETGFIQ